MNLPDMNLTERTRILNHPERAVPEETSDILVQGMVAHVGFIQDEQPFVIPMSYYYDPRQPEYLYLHGSVRSRADIDIRGAGFRSRDLCLPAGRSDC